MSFVITINGQPVHTYFAPLMDDEIVRIAAEDAWQYVVLPHLPLLRLEDGEGHSRWAEERYFVDWRNWGLLHYGALDLIQAGQIDLQDIAMENAVEGNVESAEYDLNDPIESDEFNNGLEYDPTGYQEGLLDRSQYETVFGRRAPARAQEPRRDFGLLNARRQESGLTGMEIDRDDATIEGDSRAALPQFARDAINKAEMSERKKGKLPVPDRDDATIERELRAALTEFLAQPTPTPAPTPFSAQTPFSIPTLAPVPAPISAPAPGPAAPPPSQAQFVDLDPFTPPYRGTSTIPADILAMCHGIQANAQGSPNQLPTRPYLGNVSNCPRTEFVSNGYLVAKSRLWQHWMDTRLFEGRVWLWLATKDSRPFPKWAKSTVQVEPGSVQQRLNRDPLWDPARVYWPPGVANSSTTATSTAAPSTAGRSTAAAPSGRAPKRQRTN